MLQYGAKEMTAVKNVDCAFPEGLGLVPSTTWKCMTVHNSSWKESIYMKEKHSHTQKK